MSKIDKRKAKALATLKEYHFQIGANIDLVSHDEVIVDLITDMLHLAHSREMDTDAIIRMAKTNFEAEK